MAAHPIAADYGKTWTRLLPESRYLYADDAEGEGAPGNWTRRFPHRIDSLSGKPDNSFVTNWERSPFSTTFVVDLAIHLLQKRALGTRDGTDLLALGLSSLDLVGHEFGPRSHEVQDVLARADADIGRLLDTLDRQVGPRNFVLAFSSDHGVAPVPEQATADGLDAGRIAGSDLRGAANRAIAAALGPGTYVGAADTHISLVPGTYERLRATTGAIEAVRAALAAVPGIERVFTTEELAGTEPTDDVLLRRWRLSYVAGRSGDFIVSPRPYWIIRTGAGTTHGTPGAYDSHVPVLLFGGSIRAGRYAGTTSPADIVPTLASLTGISLTQTSGRVLKEALSR